MKIARIKVTNFKGIEDAEYNLQGKNAVISGRNGSGKSTIANAHYWLWCGADYETNSNPDVFPVDEHECNPTVEEIVLIDGDEHSISKSQTKRKSKDGKITITSRYIINGVEKSQTAFKEWAGEKGIEFDNILLLSNPNAFMSEKKAGMRSLLFSMGATNSDLEIAKEIGGMDELTGLLEKYSLDEIEGMQKQTLRRIADTHGKYGEMTATKVDTLEALIEPVTEKKDDVTSEIESLTNKITCLDKTITVENKKVMDLKVVKAELVAKIAKMESDVKTAGMAGQREAQKRISECSETIGKLNGDLLHMQYCLKLAEEKLQELEKEKPLINAEYKQITGRTFDENAYRVAETCQTCGQKLTPQMVAKRQDALKAKRDADYKSFLAQKGKDKEQVIGKANKVKEQEAQAQNALRDTKEKIEKITAKITAEKAMKEEAEKMFSDNAAPCDNALNIELDGLKDSYKATCSELAAYEEVSDAEEERRKAVLKLDEAKKLLETIYNNEKVELKIKQVKQDGIAYEQQKADAEKIVYQIKQLTQAKNERLEDSLNKHFKIVKWKLFKTQKNGEIVDDCTPYIDGYAYGVSANHGRELQAQLDICYSLQNYFKQPLPVFLDNAESLNARNIIRQTGTQLITFVVTDDDLRVEVNDQC